MLAPSVTDSGAEPTSEADDELAAEEPQMVEEHVEAVCGLKNDGAEKGSPVLQA